MQIIQKSRDIRVESYFLDFRWKNDPGGGFAFPCTKEGVILSEEMHPEGLAHLEKCQDGTYDVLAKGVQDYSYTYHEHAQGLCSACSTIVKLIGFTNTCEKCGWEYNSCGQLLAPREQWDPRGEY
jgi:hypothetical protein